MKKFKVLKILGIVLAAVVLFFVTVNVIPPKKNVKSNPFVVGKGDLPMIAAHRGGGKNNPENTLLAFREALLEFSLRLAERARELGNLAAAEKQRYDRDDDKQLPRADVLEKSENHC